MNYFFEESVLIHWADCSEFQQPNGVAGHEGRQFGNHCRTLSIFAGNVRGPAVFRMDWNVELYHQIFTMAVAANRISASYGRTNVHSARRKKCLRHLSRFSKTKLLKTEI